MDIIEGRHFLNVGLSDLADDLLLLFSELSWVDYRLLLWSRLLRWCRLWRVFLLFFSLPLQFGQLSEFLIFFPLLLRVNVRFDFLALGLGLWL